MKKNLFIPLAALILLAGCDYNDKYFDGLDEISRPTDVKKIEYTLTNEDYATIASNATNKALAKERGHEDELAALKTSMTFTSTITSIDYLPAFIAAKWYTADDKSVVKITCNEEGADSSLSEAVVNFSKGELYTLTDADYKKVWGEDINIFSPSKPASDYLPELLASAIPDAEAGTYVYASYNVSDREPVTINYAFKEDFEGTSHKVDIESNQWTNIIVAGSNKWQGYAFGGNLYANISAYKHNDDLDTYLVSKKITIEQNMLLTFDALYANYVAAGGRVSVLVYKGLDEVTAETLATAASDDITSQFTIATSTSGSGDFENAGNVDLSSYAGQEIRIAFRYVGNGASGATSTIRIDNVAIKTPGRNIYSIVNSLYEYNGEAWEAYSGTDISVLSQSDFVRMGLKYDNFSSSAKPDTYLPTYMALTYPYAQQEDLKCVAYKYYDGSTTFIQVGEYKCGEGKVWARTSNVVTNQFKRTKGEWKYSPDVTIELKPGRSQPDIAEYFQAIVDYVANDPTKGEDYYQTGYKNAEFYYGASSYQNNISFKKSSWRSSCLAGEKAYGSMSDDELDALQKKRLQEAFIPALEKLHPDADLLPSGAELNYIINFGIYEDNSITKCTHTIAYKVIGKGKFEYVPDSFQPIE